MRNSPNPFNCNAMAARRNQSCSEYPPAATEMPNITKATEVGYFSVSKNEQYFDKRCLKYFRSPSDPNNVEFDLKHGYDIFENHRRMTGFDIVLRYILANKRTSQSCQTDPSVSLDADFVCRRGILRVLMNSPYCHHDAGHRDWNTKVTLYKGTYYVSEEMDVRNKWEDPSIRKDLWYWMWKFPQYVTAQEPDGISDNDGPVNNDDKFYSIVTRRIGNHTVLITGEVDCVDDQGQYVELKIKRIARNETDEHRFLKCKLRSWWIQAYICSIPKIVAGLRDEDGIIHSVKTYKTDDLPRIASERLPEWCKWKPAACVIFLDRFFDFVKSHVVEDDAECVYLLSWRKGEDMACRKLEPGTYEKILPDWYIDQLK